MCGIVGIWNFDQEDTPDAEFESSQAFLGSEIWDGPVIRKFVEDSFAREDFQAASQSWRFIHAMRLMQLFKSRSAR